MADINTPVISKIKLPGSDNTYWIKDAEGRTNMTTLLGEHDLIALGAAAWKDVDTTNWTQEGTVGTNLPTSTVVKNYVDTLYNTIHKFDVVVADALPTAAEGTMYKIYLIPKTGTEEGNAKEEWITVRSGETAPYTYAWEKIGDTEVDLSDYVQKTTTIAGITLQDDITVAELQSALELGELAYLDKGSVTVETADDLTIESYTPAGVVTLNDFTQTSTTATISSKDDYTPAGTITGEAIKGGSINVTVKDAATATAVTDITYNSYTPAGNVTLTKDNENGTFQVSGTISKPAINVNNDRVDTFVKSLKAGDTDAASFTEGTFTPASISDGFFSAGSQASYEHTGFNGGSFDKGNAVAANTDAIKVSQTVTDETLEFVAASTTNVMNHDATFTAATYGIDTFVANALPSIDTTKFNGGSKAADTFSANKLPVVDNTGSAVTAVTAELAATPTFTGDKFVPAFGGTSADIKFAGAKYLKQEIDAKTFIPETATLGFSGTKAEQLIPTEVKYDKATANGASFTGTTEILTGTLNKTEKTIDVDFE